MSIVRVEYPAAGGSAAFPDDYNLQNDLLAAIIAQGDNALKLTEWDSDDTEPEVKLGVYIRHNGTYYLVTSSNEAISGTPTDLKQNYVKLTPAGGGATLTASWVDEDGIGAYAYDFTKDGWYDGDDQILEEFMHLDTGVYINRKYQDHINHTIFWDQLSGQSVPDYLEIGTLVIAASTVFAVGTQYLPGTTYAGSTLIISNRQGVNEEAALSAHLSEDMIVNTSQSQSLGASGTWVLLSRVWKGSGSASTNKPVGLFQRIS
jgi:hypothetical protein